MLRAIDADTGKQIISVDPECLEHLGRIRQAGRSGRLRCPVCQLPVLLRAGLIRVRHFAHKDLGECPSQNESVAVLEARAALYSWLKSKFTRGVTVEKVLEGTRLPRPMDCWVEYKGRRNLAYWIVDRAVRPGLFQDVASAVEGAKASLTWILLVNRLKRQQEDSRFLQLSAAMARCIARSPYDTVYSPRFSGTLHYLDGAAKMLITFRALRPAACHWKYEGHEISTPLAQVLVRPDSGEPVHPGEQELLAAWKAKTHKTQARCPIVSPRFTARSTPQNGLLEQDLMAVIRGQAGPSPTRKRMRWSEAATAEDQEPAPEVDRLAFHEAACSICGKKTTDWSVYCGKTGMCKCNACLAKMSTGPKNTDGGEHSCD
jgi:hypothetical protein